MDGFLERDGSEDVTATLELGIGRSLGEWLAVLAYQYRYRTDLDALAVTESLGRPSQFHVNVASHLIDVSLMRRWRLSASFNAFLGAGVGLVMNRADGEFIVRELGSVPELRTSDENIDAHFSWNLQAGIARSFGARWEAELRYRYVTLGTVRSGPYDDSSVLIETGQEMESHDWSLGVTYRF